MAWHMDETHITGARSIDNACGNALRQLRAICLTHDVPKTREDQVDKVIAGIRDRVIASARDIPNDVTIPLAYMTWAHDGTSLMLEWQLWRDARMNVFFDTDGGLYVTYASDNSSWGREFQPDQLDDIIDVSSSIVIDVVRRHDN